MWKEKEGGEMVRIVFVFLLAISAWSTPLYEKFPSYSYVFEEFDIDETFIYNDDFGIFVKKNEERYRKFYRNSLKRGGYLIPTFKSMLLQDGLSDLFVYMSMIESGFSTDCVSCKSAVGIWQFMEATAKEYDLSVNSDFDERLDPILATSAAMNYMHELYKEFDKWYLVAMAYNCGEGRLEKAIRRAGTDNISVLMSSEENYIPKETRTYIKKILLVAMIGEDISLGLEKSEEVEEELRQLYGENIVQVDVEPGERLEYIARIIHMDPKELLKLNHHFKNGTIPVKLPSYKINIPTDKVVDFYAVYALQKELKKYAKTHYLSHIVQQGEGLGKIADRYETTPGEILIYNPQAKKGIDEGQVLVIPVTKAVFETFSR